MSFLATLSPKHPDGKISIACAVFLSYQIVTGAINDVLSPILGFGFIWDSAFIYAIALFFILRASRSILQRQLLDSLLMISFISIFIGATYIFINEFSTQYRYLIHYVPCYFGFCIPAYLLFRAIRRPETLTAKFKPVGIVVCSSAVAITILTKILAIDTGEYNMVFGYQVLTGVVLLTDDLFERFRMSSALLIAVTLLIILFYGSRGPILCYSTFIAIKLLLSNKLSYRKKIFILAILSIAALLTIQFYMLIIERIIESANRFGFQARTLHFLLDGKITGGRFFDKLFEAMDQIGLLGLGVAGDTNIFGMYSHNIFFETLLSFGWLFGTSILCYILFFMVYGVFLSKNTHYQRISMTLFCCSFIKLLVSGTFITESLLYACIAVSTASFFHDRRSVWMAHRTAIYLGSQKIRLDSSARRTCSEF